MIALTPTVLEHVKQLAPTIGLDPLLVGAIIMQESACDLYAVRFEPGWNLYKDPVKFAKKLRISVDTEKSMQAHSYGLMQLMGTVMREKGFDGPWALAYDMEINITCGCRHLKMFLERHGGFEREAISAYNAGTPTRTASGEYVNQAYVDGVLKYKEALKAQFTGVA